MTNPYIQYYLNQAGSGSRYQRGHGFFGRLFSSTIFPALKFIGRKALTTGVDIAQDALQGQNIKESAKSRLSQAAVEVAEQGLNQLKRKLQEGRGNPYTTYFKRKKRRRRQ